MGVMSDLSGKSEVTPAKLEDREFLEFDSDNFDDRLKSIKPRVAFNVPNVMTGEGNLAVDLTFDSMEDFSPDKVAAKIDGVKELLEAREQLSNLLSYMDGKTGAEELISKLLEDETLLKALAAKAKQPSSEDKE
jgi:type VI secretion system protein ImpB